MMQYIHHLGVSARDETNCKRPAVMCSELIDGADVNHKCGSYIAIERKQTVKGNSVLIIYSRISLKRNFIYSSY